MIPLGATTYDAELKGPSLPRVFSGYLSKRCAWYSWETRVDGASSEYDKYNKQPIHIQGLKMINFNEFLAESEEMITEAGERMTKLKWQSAMDLVPPGERDDFMKFSSVVQKLYGIDTNNAKEYYKVQAAFKSLRGDKAPAKAKAPATKPVAPKPMAAPKTAPVPKVEPKPAPKAAEVPKGSFNTKSYIANLRKAMDALNEARKDALALDSDFKKMGGNRSLHNLKDPAMMSLYVIIEDFKYLTPAIKEIDGRIRRAINELPKRVEAAVKEEAERKAAK